MPGASRAWRFSRGNLRRSRRSPCRDRQAACRFGGARTPPACPAGWACEPCLPGFAHIGAARADAAPPVSYIIGDHKRRVLPAEPLARPLDLLGAQRRAVRCGGAGLGRRAKPDDRLAGDEARPVLALRPFQPVGDRAWSCRRRAWSPSHAPRTGDLVVGDREACRAVDRDRIVVPQHGQLLSL